MFCAGDSANKDAAEGDSGGPAVFNNTLIGIISAGISEYKALGTYTKVNRYYYWILENILYNNNIFYYYWEVLYFCKKYNFFLLNLTSGFLSSGKSVY